MMLASTAYDGADSYRSFAAFLGGVFDFSNQQASARCHASIGDDASRVFPEKLRETRKTHDRTVPVVRRLPEEVFDLTHQQASARRHASSLGDDASRIFPEQRGATRKSHLKNPFFRQRRVDDHQRCRSLPGRRRNAAQVSSTPVTRACAVRDSTKLGS